MYNRELVTAILLALACFLGTFGVGTLTATPASASVAASSHTKLWWDGTTCRAFTAFGSRPTAERFRHLVQDARHSDTYLRADVGAWADDRAQHLSHAVLADDWLFVADDCGGSYGL